MRRLAAAAITAGLLATTTGSAQAAPLGFDCHFAVAAQAVLTGSFPVGYRTYTGVVIGYSDVNDQAEIRCYVTGEGNELASTPVGTGTDLAVTVGQVTFTVADTDDVQLCAAPSPDPGTHRCRTPSRTEIPDAGVRDLLTGVSESVVCPALRVLAGLRVPGVLEIDLDGDVFLLSRRVWDCAPFEPPNDAPVSPVVVLIA